MEKECERCQTLCELVQPMDTLTYIYWSCPKCNSTYLTEEMLTPRSEDPMEESQTREFIDNCLNLDADVRMHCSNGYSDREITSVLALIMKEIIDRQNDPYGAIDQLMNSLKRPKSEGDKKDHTPSDP